jgi:hypothetical protein
MKILINNGILSKMHFEQPVGGGGGCITTDVFSSAAIICQCVGQQTLPIKSRLDCRSFWQGPTCPLGSFYHTFCAQRTAFRPQTNVDVSEVVSEREDSHSFPGVKRPWRDATTHLHLVARVRMYGAMPPLAYTSSRRAAQVNINGFKFVR